MEDAAKASNYTHEEVKLLPLELDHFIIVHEESGEWLIGIVPEYYSEGGEKWTRFRADVEGAPSFETPEGAFRWYMEEAE